MNRQPVSSNNIRSVGYGPESHILEIEFHSGGVYQYLNVPESVYNGFIHASSHGSYFHRYIKNSYRWIKIR